MDWLVMNKLCLYSNLTLGKEKEDIYYTSWCSLWFQYFKKLFLNIVNFFRYFRTKEVTNLSVILRGKNSYKV